MAGCQTHAGILSADDGKLTHKAKKKFIQEVKDELIYGTKNLPYPQLFPCGDPIPANPFFEPLDLENEERFPEFHKNIIGTYEKIAKSLDMDSDFKILPICDPIALGAKLDINVSIKDFPGGFVPYFIPNLPLIALKLKFMPPPKIAAKFPTIPKVPPGAPKFEIPPKIDKPDVVFTFFDFSYAYVIGIPKLLLNLVAQLPKLILKMSYLPGVFEAICDIAFQSQIFGDIKPESIVQITAVKVLTRKVVECSFIAAVGTTIGSAGGGVTGGIGSFLGYDPYDDGQKEPPPTVRDEIIRYAERCIDLAWGPKGDTRESYCQHLLYAEWGDGEGPKDPKDPAYDPRVLPKAEVINKAKLASSCGMFVRACLAAAGATYVYMYRDAPLKSKVKTTGSGIDLWYDFFKDEYRIIDDGGGLAIAGIIQAADRKGATIPITKGDLPALKRGDVIVIYNPKISGKEHAIILYEDYVPGSFHLVTVEGGQADLDNGDRPTAIRKKEYFERSQLKKNAKEVQYDMYVEPYTNDVVIGNRKILRLIDSEILCTDPTGSNMMQPDGYLDTSLARDNNDDTDSTQFIST